MEFSLVGIFSCVSRECQNLGISSADGSFRCSTGGHHPWGHLAMIANAQRRDLGGQRLEDREPERENEPTTEIWLKKPQNNRNREFFGCFCCLLLLLGFVAECEAKAGSWGERGSAEAKEQPRESLGSQVKSQEGCNLIKGRNKPKRRAKEPEPDPKCHSQSQELEPRAK